MNTNDHSAGCRNNSTAVGHSLSSSIPGTLYQFSNCIQKLYVSFSTKSKWHAVSWREALPSLGFSMSTLLSNLRQQTPTKAAHNL